MDRDMNMRQDAIVHAANVNAAPEVADASRVPHAQVWKVHFFVPSSSSRPFCTCCLESSRYFVLYSGAHVQMVTMASLDSVRTTTSEAPSINEETVITAADYNASPMASAACPNRLEDESPCQSPLSPKIPAFFSGSQPVLQMLRKSITPTRYHWMKGGKGPEKVGKGAGLGAASKQWCGRVCDTVQQRLVCFVVRRYVCLQPDRCIS